MLTLDPSGLPSGWRVMSLEDACVKLKAGGTPKRGMSEYWGGDIPFVKIEDLTRSGGWIETTAETITNDGLGSSSAWLVPPGAVLLTMYGTIGKPAMLLTPMATNQAIIALIPGEEIDPLYLFFALKQWGRGMERLNVQSTQKNISARIVRSFEIPVPPLLEQRAIAHVLRTVQQASDATEQVISAARELKRSMMRHLFTYGFVAASSTDAVELADTVAGRIPADWSLSTVGDASLRVQYGISKRGAAQGRYPILRMNSLSDGRVNTQELQYVDLDDEEFEKFRLEQGDVLFNRTNSPAKVGKSALFTLAGEWVFASYLLRVQTDEQSLDSRFLAYYLNDEPTLIRLRQLATRAVSQSNINATKLRGFQVPTPPLDAQIAISDNLDAVDEKLAAEEQRRDALDALFSSLLHDLMTARVRIPSGELAEVSS